MRIFFIILAFVQLFYSEISAAAFSWGYTVESISPLIIKQDYATANALLDSIITHNHDNIDARFMKQNVLFTQMADYESYEIAGEKYMAGVDSLLDILANKIKTVSGHDSLKYLFFIGNCHGAKGLVLAKTGGILQGMAEADKSKKTMEEISALDPQLYETLYSIGLYNYYVGDYFKWVPGLKKRSLEGLRDLRNAAKSNNPFCFAAKNSLAWILLERKSYREADSVVNSVLSQFPSNTMFLQIKARSAFGRKQFTESIQLSEKLLQISVGRKPINWVDVMSGYQLIAASYYKMDNIPKAVEIAKTGLAVNVPQESLRLHWVKQHRKYLENLVK